MPPKYIVRYEERVYITNEDDPGYRQIVPDVRVIERDPLATYTTPSPGGAVAIAKPIKIPVPAEDEVHERSLNVIDLMDRKVVTVIELLSPANKVLNSFGASAS